MGSQTGHFRPQKKVIVYCFLSWMVLSETVFGPCPVVGASDVLMTYRSEFKSRLASQDLLTSLSKIDLGPLLMPWQPKSPRPSGLEKGVITKGVFSLRLQARRTPRRLSVRHTAEHTVHCNAYRSMRYNTHGRMSMKGSKNVGQEGEKGVFSLEESLESEVSKRGWWTEGVGARTSFKGHHFS